MPSILLPENTALWRRLSRPIMKPYCLSACCHGNTLTLVAGKKSCSQSWRMLCQKLWEKTSTVQSESNCFSQVITSVAFGLLHLPPHPGKRESAAPPIPPSQWPFLLHSCACHHVSSVYATFAKWNINSRKQNTHPGGSFACALGHQLNNSKGRERSTSGFN